MRWDTTPDAKNAPGRGTHGEKRQAYGRLRWQRLQRFVYGHHGGAGVRDARRTCPKVASRRSTRELKKKKLCNSCIKISTM
jgi:hypothetical protein